MIPERVVLWRLKRVDAMGVDVPNTSILCRILQQPSGGLELALDTCEPAATPSGTLRRMWTRPVDTVDNIMPMAWRWKQEIVDGALGPGWFDAEPRVRTWRFTHDAHGDLVVDDRGA